MPTTTRYSFGDIVLVPFPFTDQSGIKQRPAVVISSAAYHQARRDVLIMAVTSQVRPGMHGEVEVKHWREAGLIKASVIKPVIATIEAALIIRRLGHLATSASAQIRHQSDRRLETQRPLTGERELRPVVMASVGVLGFIAFSPTYVDRHASAIRVAP